MAATTSIDPSASSSSSSSAGNHAAAGAGSHYHNNNTAANGVGVGGGAYAGGAPTAIRRNISSSGLSDHGGSGAVIEATEGWLELFLTPAEKYNFSRWNERVLDRSLTHHLLHPAFHWASRTFLPDTVAPNVITLAGLLSLAQAWYILNLYGEDYPVGCCWFSVANILVFFCTNCTDGIHAVRIRQNTALGELFKYGCDGCAAVFLAVLLVYRFGGINEIATQWYAVQIMQLVLYLKHLSAFSRQAGLRYALAGPGEVILSSVLLLATSATFGLDNLISVYEARLHRPVFQYLVSRQLLDDSTERAYRQDPTELATDLVRYAYYGMYAAAVVKTVRLNRSHAWTRFGLLASLTMRLGPAVLFRLTSGAAAAEYGVADVICDGLFMAVLTSDITLAKMAGRELHPWVILMSMAALVSHSVILACVLTYYIAVFCDLCAYMNMPLLTTCRNVYCDGIFDLCHIGHKRLFLAALQHGNRLFVGVVGDADAQQYKRPPIMNHAERCAEVEACKAVTKVIPNAPCFGLTEDFLHRHQIHVVAYGREYLDRYPNPADDPYYRVPRELGIARPLPRTDGLSTTDLIRRIQSAVPADDKKTS